ncbi:Type 1 glutamine amidotransferase-like domain-containing protein [Actinocorallia lasiicapitis]
MSEHSRLFLGSAGLGALPVWLDSLARRPRRAVLIPTAARPMASAPFVRTTADFLGAQSVAVTYLDLADATPAEVRRALTATDLVYVTGGYAVYLLEQAVRSGFLELARPLIRSGELPYAGISAGAALAGPDLTPLSAPDDPGRLPAPPTPTALRLTPYVVLAHRNRDRADHHTRLATLHPHLPFLSLTDAQALTVEGPAHAFIPSP